MTDNTHKTKDNEVSNPEAEILTIKKIFAKENLRIPDYQRPYKWETRHILQLMNDLLHHFQKQQRHLGEKYNYRLGTIVLCEEKEQSKSDIVDGQQRLISLTLLLRALKETVNFGEQELQHTISQQNICQNYRTIEEFINEHIADEILKKAFKTYLQKQCEVLCITLTDIDESFQFFDSQNARGKPLEPYDLLKAYHLRAMHRVDEKTVHRCVERWEKAAEKSPADDKENLVVS